MNSGGTRPVLPDDPVWWQLLALSGLTGFVALAVFVAAPSIDIVIARLFFDGHGFTMLSDEIAALRLVYKAVFVGLCVLAVLGLVHALLWPCTARAPLKLWLFAAAVPLVGPGLLANGLFKPHWGRARPAEITAFGSDAAFTRPFEIAGQCVSNCSFLSGEVSSATAILVVLAGLFGARAMRSAGRTAWQAAAALWLLGGAAIRIVPGRHFASDTLFAVLIVVLVGLGLYALLGVGRARASAGPREMAHDLASAARRLAAGPLRAAAGAFRGSSPTG